MKDQKDIKKWWQYIDGDLDAADQAAFQEELQQNEELANIFQESQSLENHLVEIEAEEPAMRFSMNVLEDLPTLYKKVNIEPFFSRRTILLGSLALLISIIITYLAAFSGKSTTVEGLQPTWLEYVQSLPQLPSSALVLAALAGFCLVSIYLIDLFIKKRFLNRLQK